MAIKVYNDTVVVPMGEDRSVRCDIANMTHLMAVLQGEKRRANVTDDKKIERTSIEENRYRCNKCTNTAHVRFDIINTSGVYISQTYLCMECIGSLRRALDELWEDGGAKAALRNMFDN